MSTQKFSLPFIITILCTAVMIMSTGCSEKTLLRKINPTSDEKKVVGTVGDYEIYYDELRCITINYRTLLKNNYGENIFSEDESAKYTAMLNDYVRSALAINANAVKTAKEYGISIDDKEVTEFVELKLNMLASELAELLVSENSDNDSYVASKNDINKKYIEYLKENYISDRYNRYVFGVDGCLEQLKLNLINTGVLSSDDDWIKAYINENFVRVIHVYSPINSFTDADTARNNAEFVEWILKSDIRSEENSAALRARLNISEKEASDGSSSKAKFYKRITDTADINTKMTILVGSIYNKDTKISQHGYYFSYGEYSLPYETAAFALDVGEVSSVVADNNGYYVIQRLPLDPDYINENLDTLKTNYYSAYINKLIENGSSNTFEFNDYGKSLDLTTLK